jgi:hypothetical protein
MYTSFSENGRKLIGGLLLQAFEGIESAQESNQVDDPIDRFLKAVDENGGKQSEADYLILSMVKVPLFYTFGSMVRTWPDEASEGFDPDKYL